MRVLIVGAGITGTAAAKGFLAAGHEVTVLERAPALRDTGCAIVLWPNGTTVLGDLGVRLDGAGERIEALDAHSSRGRPVMSVDTVRLEERFGAPTLGITRPTLLARLVEDLPEEIFRFGAHCAHVHDDGRVVRVATEDGAEYSADLLIGADGVNSRVRTALFGPALTARPTGVATWQGLVDAPFDLGSRALMFLGREGGVGINPAGGGKVNWLIDFRLRQEDGQAGPGEALTLLRNRYRSWAPPVTRLLDALTGRDLALFPHRRHPAPLRWSSGRCALIGDAVHTMPPILAQGAGQGLEDVAALLRALDGLGADDDPAAALRAYGRSRDRQAVKAADAATRGIATSGPRTLLQSEAALRAAVLMPRGTATRMFEQAISGVSTRLSPSRV
ncbi:FAD-dependent monooxygenase [Nocardiopsis sp. EMB25]|uniref:FAD-dependent oxidoreductase n=1 Tax=Nocardiopsis sp. EMB25 TaxID=2835867 RepID=UPI0022833DC7|nr:NAD(P)/FAD-dependent oxidoreductase [Nocardiopsis sp. EMB25]MCY9783714.1 FAD-dependent monooxygenase [Nocardiopsis sp. EMB25]